MLLETETCESQCVSRDELQQMISKYYNKTKCGLQFVVVATCHSEFVGRIFLEAGAKHVICIKQSEEVEDDAVITFTDHFYAMLLEHKMKICDAFEQAQLAVSITHGIFQANIFKLLVRDNEKRQSSADKNLLHVRKQAHRCSTFGPFNPGIYKL